MNYEEDKSDEANQSDDESRAKMWCREGKGEMIHV
jgi:hypothetical protein